MYRFVL